MTDPYSHAFNDDTERQVLAVILMGRDPDAWPIFTEACRSPAVFWIRNHRLIGLVLFQLAKADEKPALQGVLHLAGQITYAEAMANLKTVGAVDPIPPLPVEHEIAYGDSLLAGIGGIAAVTDLATGRGYFRDLPKNCQALAAYHRQRRLIALATTAADDLAAVGGTDRAPIIAERLASSAAEIVGSSQQCFTLADAATSVLATHDALAKQGADERFGWWGIQTLDRHLRLAPGSLVTLAAGPGCGKTSLALHVAASTWNQCGPSSVGIVSLEMTGDELAAIQIAREIGSTREAVERGRLSFIQREAAEKVRVQFQGDNVFLKATTKGCTVDDVASWARRRHQMSSGRLTLIVIDYLQLLDKTNQRQTDYDMLREATRGLKRIAMELRVCVLVLCQINREGRKADRDKTGKVKVSPEPRMEDLQGSGSIEQDSNAVVLLWSEGNPHEATIPVRCKIAKNRAGRLAECELEFARAEGQRFSEYTGHKNTKMASDPTDDEDHFGKAAV